MGTRFDIMDLMMGGKSNIINPNGNKIPQMKTSGERQKTFTTGVEDGSNDTTQRNYTEFNPLRSNE